MVMFFLLFVIVFGVVLGMVVQVVYEVVLNEFGCGFCMLVGVVDLQVVGLCGGFDENLYGVIVSCFEVIEVSFVLEFDVRWVGSDQML